MLIIVIVVVVVNNNNAYVSDADSKLYHMVLAFYRSYKHFCIKGLGSKSLHFLLDQHTVYHIFW